MLNFYKNRRVRVGVPCGFLSSGESLQILAPSQRVSEAQTR